MKDQSTRLETKTKQCLDTRVNGEEEAKTTVGNGNGNNNHTTIGA